MDTESIAEIVVLALTAVTLIGYAILVWRGRATLRSDGKT